MHTLRTCSYVRPSELQQRLTRQAQVKACLNELRTHELLEPGLVFVSEVLGPVEARRVCHIAVLYSSFSMKQSSICLSIHLSACLSICLFVHLSVCRRSICLIDLPTYLSACLSICLTLSMYLSLGLFIYPSSKNNFIALSIYLSVYLSIYLSIYLSLYPFVYLFLTEQYNIVQSLVLVMQAHTSDGSTSLA